MGMQLWNDKLSLCATLPEPSEQCGHCAMSGLTVRGPNSANDQAWANKWVKQIQGRGQTLYSLIRFSCHSAFIVFIHKARCAIVLEHISLTADFGCGAMKTGQIWEVFFKTDELTGMFAMPFFCLKAHFSHTGSSPQLVKQSKEELRLKSLQITVSCFGPERETEK